jgi:hypothetical protein
MVYKVAMSTGTGSAKINLKIDVWLPFIETNANRLQLLFEQGSLDVLLGGVQHHHHKICSPSYGNDLSSSTLALGGTFNDSRQVEKLNVSTLVIDDTRDAC